MSWLTNLWTYVQNISFADPVWLWLAFAPLILLPLWKRLRPAMANTFGHGHKLKSVGWPKYLCTVLFVLCWEAFTVAVSGPQMAETAFAETYQAREFQIFIDSSGSMFSSDVKNADLAKKVRAWENEMYTAQMAHRAKYPELYPVEPKKPEEVTKGNEDSLTRFQLARYAAYQFVLSRITANEAAIKAGKQGDRIGIGTFDDATRMSWPLSSDLPLVLRAIENLLTTSSGGGTNFEGPTDSDPRKGAFQTCIDLFNNKRLSKEGVKTKVMIFISDGDAGISPKRFAELEAQMKESATPIHVFSFVTGSESQMSNTATESMRRLVKAVNPNDPSDPVKTKQFQNAVIWAGDGVGMIKAFDTINELEPATVQGEPFVRKRDCSHEFTLAGCLLATMFFVGCVLFREGF